MNLRHRNKQRIEKALSYSRPLCIFTELVTPKAFHKNYALVLPELIFDQQSQKYIDGIVDTSDDLDLTRHEFYYLPILEPDKTYDLHQVYQTHNRFFEEILIRQKHELPKILRRDEQYKFTEKIEYITSNDLSIKLNYPPLSGESESVHNINNNTHRKRSITRLNNI